MIKKEIIKGLEATVIDTNKVLKFIDRTIDESENDIKRIIIYNYHDEIKEPIICKELKAILMCRKVYEALRKEAECWNVKVYYIHGVPIIFEEGIDNLKK
jgi:hypothetical protein